MLEGKFIFCPRAVGHPPPVAEYASWQKLEESLRLIEVIDGDCHPDTRHLKHVWYDDKYQYFISASASTSKRLAGYRRLSASYRMYEQWARINPGERSYLEE